MRHRMRMGFLAAALAASQTGCLSRLAANSTVGIMNRASPALEAYSDPGLAEGALPYSITQMEGLLRVVPDNGVLRVNLMRAYGSFGFGFLEDHMEQAEVDDDEARIEHYRSRASMMYVRSKELGFDQMNREEDGDGGPMAAYHGGIDRWRAYLQRFDDAEQAGLIFWTGYAWARHINLNKEDPDVLADLPYAIACFERMMQLDPTFNRYAPMAAMGAYYARAAPSLGGEPDRSRQMFEDAIRHTDRHFLTYLVLEARAYAVMVQDRRLFRSLLEEVINAGDVMPEQRLANQIAKRRARRYLARIDDLFGPEETPTDADTAPSETPPDFTPPPAPAAQ